MKTYYDLSYGFDEDSFHPFGFPSFRNIQMFPSHGVRHAYVTLSLHTATHMDAPWHMVENGRRMDEIPVQELIGDAVVIDVSEYYRPENATAAGVALEHIESRLREKGLDVKEGDALVVYMGWARIFQSDPSHYYGHYCTLSYEAAQWVRHKKLRLVAIDAPDIDLPSEYTEQPFRATNHRLLLGNGIYIIENLGGEVEKVLDQRVELIPAPLKVGGGYASGAPVRLLARV